ncbi:unnamed protein product, partial [marine sediment metagenome]
MLTALASDFNNLKHQLRLAPYPSTAANYPDGVGAIEVLACLQSSYNIQLYPAISVDRIHQFGFPEESKNAGALDVPFVV